MVNFSLEGKVALVTGAAYGIGLAIAQAFAEAGAKIVYNCSRRETLERGAAAYKELGIDAKGYLCDVTDEESVKAMVADIEATVGTIDILVNNAGIIKRIPMEEMAADEFRRVIDVDLVGPFICSKAVIPGMKKKGHGKIINICSMMSELGRETVSAYAAAKGGLKMLTRNIASEYGEFNIQCNGIGPGYIATEQTACYPSTHSLSQRLRQLAGELPTTSKVRPYSSLPTLPTSSTDMYSMSTEAYLLTSVNSPSNECIDKVIQLPRNRRGSCRVQQLNQEHHSHQSARHRPF